MIADNRLAEFASWDEKRLGETLQELKTLDLDFALSATGFEIGEIDLGLEAVRRDAPGPDPGRGKITPGSQPGGRRHGGAAAPVARAGETWTLGPHRLACGDAGDEAAYRALDAAIRRWQAETGRERPPSSERRRVRQDRARPPPRRRRASASTLAPLAGRGLG